MARVGLVDHVGGKAPDGVDTAFVEGSEGRHDAKRKGSVGTQQTGSQKHPKKREERIWNRRKTMKMLEQKEERIWTAGSKKEGTETKKDRAAKKSSAIG
jgi:hypothetical protein